MCCCGRVANVLSLGKISGQVTWQHACQIVKESTILANRHKFVTIGTRFLQTKIEGSRSRRSPPGERRGVPSASVENPLWSISWIPGTIGAIRTDNWQGRRVAAVSYTHLRAHETVLDLVCRLLLEKKKNKKK